MTLKDIEKIPKDFLTPTDAAPVLHCSAHYITIAARNDPKSLGFPVIVMGRRTRIPKEAFLKYCRGDLVPLYGQGQES